MDKDSRNHGKGSEAQLPPGQSVFIEYNGDTCLAYLDANGNWRDYYNGDVLDGEVIYKRD